MARYYNTTRGSLALSLSSGSFSLPAKSWTEIPTADEGSPNLAPLVRTGFLVRCTIDSVPAVEPVPVPVPVPVVEPPPPPPPARAKPAETSLAVETIEALPDKGSPDLPLAGTKKK